MAQWKVRTKSLCIACQKKQQVTYNRCSKCFNALKKGNPREYQRLRAMSRAERKAKIEASSRSVQRWTWEGDETTLAEKYGN
jgi:hypothetical protein